MNILIFGGAGFVGSNLAFYLTNKGHYVTVFDNLVRRGSENNIPIFKEMNIRFQHGDIRNKEDFVYLKDKKYDVILECAAQPSAINYANPKFDITNNTFGLLNVLEFCKDTQTPLIFWSTNKVYCGSKCNEFSYKISGRRFEWLNQPYYNQPVGWNPKLGFSENFSIDGNDHSIYGVSKIMSDLLIQEMADAYKIPAIINRFSCLAGPNQWGIADQGWVAWFAIANEFKLGLNVYGFDGMQVRDYLFTKDINLLIEKQIATLTSSDNKFFGEVFNVGGGRDFSISINEAIDFLGENYNSWKSINYIDPNITRRADQAIYLTNNTKVMQTFNWKPTVNYKDGYKEIFEWIYKNKNKLREMYV